MQIADQHWRQPTARIAAQIHDPSTWRTVGVDGAGLPQGRFDVLPTQRRGPPRSDPGERDVSHATCQEADRGYRTAIRAGDQFLARGSRGEGGAAAARSSEPRNDLSDRSVHAGVARLFAAILSALASTALRPPAGV